VPLVITEHDECLMQQWREQFPGDVRDEEDFYATQRADRHCRQAFAERKIDNPNTTLDDEDLRWDNIWTSTTSEDE
jgi:hypothetical protein